MLPLLHSALLAEGCIEHYQWSARTVNVGRRLALGHPCRGFHQGADLDFPGGGPDLSLRVRFVAEYLRLRLLPAQPARWNLGAGQLRASGGRRKKRIFEGDNP